MKVNLLPAAPAEGLAHRVPPAYRDAVQKATCGTGTGSLLLSPARRATWFSRRRFARSSGGSPGPRRPSARFTAEALTLLAEAGA